MRLPAKWCWELMLPDMAPMNLSLTCDRERCVLELMPGEGVIPNPAPDELQRYVEGVARAVSRLMILASAAVLPTPSKSTSEATSP